MVSTCTVESMLSICSIFGYTIALDGLQMCPLLSLSDGMQKKR